MGTMTTEKAAALFDGGLYCAQIVVAHGAEQLGEDAATARRMASGLAAGCKRGEICGCLTGAILALGLAYGKATGEEELQNDLLPRLVNELEDRFAAQHGTVLCRDLIGYDRSRPEGPDNMPRDDMYDGCPTFMAEVCEILDDLLGRATE